MMRYLCLVSVGLALGCALVTDGAAVRAADDDKGTVVDLDGLKSRTPPEWKKEVPKFQMRFAQFRLPKVKDDKYDAEIVIFKGIGGSSKDNIDRWKKMFVPPEGKTLEDVAKVKKLKAGAADADCLDINGTYLYKEAPFDPKAKVERRPDYRMLGVIYEAKENPYHIRLVGPAQTVEHYRQGFEEWLKEFK